MKPRPLIHLLLFLTLTATACGRRTSRFSDPNGAFEIRYPASWTVSNEAGAAVFSAPGNHPRESLVVTRVARKDGTVTRTEASLLDNLMIQFKALPDFALTRSQTARVAGLDAHMLSVTFTNRGLRYRKDQYVVPLRDHFVAIDCNAPESVFDEKLFAHLLSTLEVPR